MANRIIRRLVVITGGFISAEIGVWIAVTAIAYGFGGVDLASRLLVAQLLPATALALFVGGFIARWGTTRVMVGGFLAQSVGLTIAGGALALSAPRMVFYVGAVIASTFVVAIRPSVAANLPLVVEEPNELVAANVVVGWVTAAATLSGPLIVALTVSIGSGATPLFVYAGVTAAGAAVASTVPNFRERTVESAPGDDGVRKLAGSSGPFVAVVLIGAASFVVGCVDLLYVVVGVGVLGGTEASAGWLSTAAGCGALVGGALAVLLIGRKRLWPWVLAAGAFTATALALLGASGSVLIAALVFAGVDLGVTVLLIAARTLLQRLSDIDTLSHLAGIAESAEMAMLLAGAIALPLFVKISSPAGSGVLVGAVVGVTIVAAAVVLIRIEASFVVPVEALGLLRSCQLLELLPAPALETLAGAAVRIELSDGEVLFSAGDVGDRYYVIAGGQVRMTSEGAEIAVRGPGEGFGELALLHPIGRTATATAVGDVELLGIDRQTFLFAVTGHRETLERSGEVARGRGFAAG